MPDPVAVGPAAAIAATVTTAAPMLALGAMMPPGASLNEFAWGCAFAIFGAFAYQFIKAQARRQAAADKDVPVADRPEIDKALVGYAMFGAPLSAACLIFVIHQFHGATGFGDTTWLQSAAGFMVAGAAGPELVLKVVGALVTFIGSKSGGSNK